MVLEIFSIWFDSRWLQQCSFCSEMFFFPFRKISEEKVRLEKLRFYVLLDEWKMWIKKDDDESTNP